MATYHLVLIKIVQPFWYISYITDLCTGEHKVVARKEFITDDPVSGILIRYRSLAKRHVLLRLSLVVFSLLFL